ncbi:hypothetical protein [Lentibacillus sp. CBA3610]|uniref:hypothetical protein n=1 Tax=Lentibacillus sp. CBA3610 TaxID=2518176 RepID=UPI001595D975|nr:hypothetical protein [Lentibacillus sp. CBA3610]QKY69867.1 hypothetical protein Len3610_09940 [Lentibacillus sp. CBA3610]
MPGKYADSREIHLKSRDVHTISRDETLISRGTGLKSRDPQPISRICLESAVADNLQPKTFLLYLKNRAIWQKSLLTEISPSFWE